MALPDPSALVTLAPDSPIASVQRYRELRFSGSELGWKINGMQFDPQRTDYSPVLDTAEEWTLVSEVDHHPFHMHVNPFLVTSIKNRMNQESLTSPVWKDTILLQDGHTITLRTRFRRYVGKTVLHCHKLDHEDKGMMQMFRIVPPGPEGNKRTSAGPGGNDTGMDDALPHVGDYRTPTVECTSWGDYAGRMAVLVFFRGYGCQHCLEQLPDLRRAATRFGNGRHHGRGNRH